MWLINITYAYIQFQIQTNGWRLMILKLTPGKLNKWFIVFLEFAFSRRIIFGVKNMD